MNKAQKTDKPWGYELLFAHTDKYAGKVLFVSKGHRLSLQFHDVKDETIYVYQGKIHLQFGGVDGNLVEYVLIAGDSVRVEPLSRHRIEALEDTTLLEVSTPELGDVRRLEDDYGRA
jgi:mannose-6-phosphate isomerase-like protein (cupin superfamily)